MIDLIALMTIILWPVIPLFWIPVHLAPQFFKKLGILTYSMLFVTWLPLVFLIYQNRDYILYYRIDFSAILIAIGIFLLMSGIIVHIWTGKLLGFWGLIGLPEVSKTFKSRLVTWGAFSFSRHPTYVAHTMILFGIFLTTGVIVVGIIVVLDLALVLALIIPFEERELLTRFGDEYNEYRRRVPRFLPF